MNIAKELSFGDRVYNLRKKNRLTQMELAKKIGSSKGTIQNYEANTLPKGEYAINLAEVFQCSIDWLLTGKNSAPIYKSKDLKNEVPGQDSPSQNDNLIVIEHQDIIRRFKDPEKAKEFNEFLVEIEGDDPEGYDELFKEARVIAKTIKRLRDKKNISENGNGIAVNGD